MEKIIFNNKKDFLTTILKVVKNHPDFPYKELKEYTWLRFNNVNYELQNKANENLDGLR